jgi:anti-sigma B factor antagonist
VVHAGPSVVVVNLPAEIDITNAAAIRDELLTALESGAAVVIADMTGTTFSDTMGIRTLILTHKHAAAKEAELRLALSSRLVLRILSAMGLDGYFSIYPTVAEAQAAGTATEEPGT